MIYHIETQQIITRQELKKRYPEVSFPKNPNDQQLEIFGCVRVQPTPRPEGDVVTQGQPEYSPEDGQWYQTWETRDFTPDELEEQQQILLGELENTRKDAESLGVIVNGIRYAGDPSNRQALLEVIQFARESGVEVFPMWKDSDSQFHPNHPLTEVEQALMQIAARRSALIALEGQYAAQLLDGTLDAIDDLSWEAT